MLGRVPGGNTTAELPGNVSRTKLFIEAGVLTVVQQDQMSTPSEAGYSPRQIGTNSRQFPLPDSRTCADPPCYSGPTVPDGSCFQFVRLSIRSACKTTLQHSNFCPDTGVPLPAASLPAGHFTSVGICGPQTCWPPHTDTLVNIQSVVAIHSLHGSAAGRQFLCMYIQPTSVMNPF